MSSSRIMSAIRLPPMPTIRDVVRMYKLRAMKQLSQNFLLDEKVVNKFVRAAGDISNGYVCEVGPGPGGITRSLLSKQPAEVVVIEKDPRFVPTLEMLGDAVQDHLKFKIIVGDVLRTDFKTMFPDIARRQWEDHPPDVHLVGNLPFNISTILIIRWLEAISKKEGAWTYGRTRMTLTFQKEVAERMAAPIMSPQRCRLSVMCQNWCSIEHKFTIPGSAFLPRPDVDVGVVTFTPLKKPIIPVDFKIVEKFLRNVFHMRQKYIIKGIRNLFPPGHEDLATRMFQMADLDPTCRSYECTNYEFKRLCVAYDLILKDYPEFTDYNFRASKKDLIKNVDVYSSQEECLVNS